MLIVTIISIIFQFEKICIHGSLSGDRLLLQSHPEVLGHPLKPM